jgi:hypothetical protein
VNLKIKSPTPKLQADMALCYFPKEGISDPSGVWCVGNEMRHFDVMGTRNALGG